MTVTVSVQVARCPQCGAEAVLPVEAFPHFRDCSRLETLRVRSYVDFLPKTRDPNPEDADVPGNWETQG